MGIVPDITGIKHTENTIKTTPIIPIQPTIPYSVYHNINSYSNYIVPIQHNNFNAKVIIHAINSKQAMEIAAREFSGDGWIINREHYNYKKI